MCRQALRGATVLIAAVVTVAVASPVLGMDKGIGQTSSYPKRSEFPQQNSYNPYLNFTEQDFTWRELEPTEGNYQWQILDDYIARWAGTGKKIVPHIVIAHNTTANPTYTNAVPQYVYDAGADFISWVGQDSVTRVRPVPWDAIFLAKFATFVQTFAARYDGNPAIWNVDITLGLFSTTLLATTQSEAFPLYGPKGYSELVWSNAIRQATTIYRNAFQITPLRFVVTYFTGSDDGTAAGALAKEAAAQGIIIHNHSLRATSGFLNNDPWLRLFEEIHQLYPSAKTSFGTDVPVQAGTITQVAPIRFWWGNSWRWHISEKPHQLLHALSAGHRQGQSGIGKLRCRIPGSTRLCTIAPGICGRSACPVAGHCAVGEQHRVELAERARDQRLGLGASVTNVA